VRLKLRLVDMQSDRASRGDAHEMKAETPSRLLPRQQMLELHAVERRMFLPLKGVELPLSARYAHLSGIEFFEHVHAAHTTAPFPFLEESPEFSRPGMHYSLRGARGWIVQKCSLPSIVPLFSCYIEVKEVFVAERLLSADNRNAVVSA